MKSTDLPLGRVLLFLSAATLAAQLAAACSSDGGGDGGPRDAMAGAANTGGDGNGTGGNGSGGKGQGGDVPVDPGDDVCSTDADCQGDLPVCDPVQGCVACLFDWDCPADHRCENNECFAKQLCTSSDDCTKDEARSLCDEVLGECVECREDATCGEGKRCERGACVTFSTCKNSRDCSEGLVCDGASGACVTCVVDGDCGEGSSCVDNSCLPTCDSDKDCLAVSLLCDQTEGHCVECLADADCPGVYHCESGRCELDACEPGQTRCENPATLGTCDPTGRGFVNSTCGFGTSCQEQGASAACKPWTCEPSEKVCSEDGKSVSTCNADGTGVASETPCEANQLCLDGECRPVVCEAGENFCEENVLRKCNATGTASTLLDTCQAYYGESCDASLDQCAPAVCSAYSNYCDGEVAKVCNSDGSGPVNAGTDCSLTGTKCYQGQCQPKVCEAQYSCVDASLYKCANNGTYKYEVAYCGAPGLCDAAAGACKSPVCTPNEFVCNGNVATRCKSDGSGYEAGGVDCAQDGTVCDGGGCLPKVCEPSAYFCQTGSPQKCSASGATYAPSDSCSSYEFCKDGSQYCLADVCTAGANVCNGNVATTCAADGSGPIAGGTDCTQSGQICDAGSCKSVVCTPGSTSCIGDAVYTCSAAGTAWNLSQTCSASAYCKAGSTATCATDICAAGATGCDAEVVSTCASNGGSWINPGTSCKAAGDVCTAGGVCADEEVTTQGSATYATSSSNYLHALGFHALSPRKLTKLEFYASVTGLVKFTWVVYEKRASNSTYDVVYQKVTAQTQSAVGYISSGPLDFTFQKDKTYAVGVHVSGTATYYYSSIAPVTAFGTSHVSLVASTYAANAPAATSFSTTTSTRPHLKMTTTLAN